MARSLLRSLGTTVLLFALALTLSSTSTPAQTTTLIRHSRVFDGTRVLGERDVLMRGGRIARVAPSIPAPAGAAVVDGTGKTLLPGFIDAHTHSYGDALEQALAFGVTTSLDMFTEPAEAAARRAEQRAGNVASRADLFSAGVLVTAPGGHGSEYGIPIPTISVPESAQAFVDVLVKQGSDWVKIVIDDGSAYGPRRIPTLNAATVRALVRAAHARGKLAVAHVGTLADAHVAIDAGVDGLVHLFTDRAPEADFGRYVARHHAFVIPTLTVLSSVVGLPGGAALAKDPLIAPYVSAASGATLLATFPFKGSRDLSSAELAVRQLKAAGVSLLAGTDAPNPGTGHGSSLHQELANLVHAGLTPLEALTAATATPARMFRLADRGRIEAGRRADLVLVDGDPTRDIAATRALVGIWKGGERLDRAAVATRIAAQRVAANAAPVLGLVSDFESGKPTSSFGSGWFITTDAFAGGKSTAVMAVADGGARGSMKSLDVSGTIAPGMAFAWAGVMFMPGQQPMAPVNLSAAKELRFWAKGDGRGYTVMLFSRAKGNAPVTQSFVADTEWKEYVFPIASFAGIDGHDIMGIAITAAAPVGTFVIRLDDVRIQ